MDKFFGYDQYFKKIPDSLKAKWVRIKPLKWGFTKGSALIPRQVNKEKALAVFTYCYEKKMEPGKL